MANYFHGVSTRQNDTSISTPVTADSGIAFVVGAAPGHTVDGAPNDPIMCQSYAEAVAALGYSDDWEKYPICEAILWLVDLIVDSTENPGIPIGNQTSQWFAVMYLSGMDHFIKEKLGIRYYGRYMDDFYLIHEDKAYLQYCRGEIEQYVARLGLRMNEKTNIFPLRNGIDFLGFHTYLTESGKIIRKVRRSSKCNAQRKLKKQRGLLDREKISLSDIEQSYGSWRSHAAKGNCYHLIQKTDSLFQNLFKESEKQWPKV